MAFIRHYMMRSAPENAEALAQALAALRDAVISLTGSLRIDLLHAPTDPGYFFFIEHWASKADHSAAGAALPPSLMAPLKSMLIQPPVANDLTDEALTATG